MCLPIARGSSVRRSAALPTTTPPVSPRSGATCTSQDVPVGCGRGGDERSLRGRVGTEHLRICGRGTGGEGGRDERDVGGARSQRTRRATQRNTHAHLVSFPLLSNPASADFRCSEEDEERVRRREEERKQHCRVECVHPLRFTRRSGWGTAAILFLSYLF